MSSANKKPLRVVHQPLCGNLGWARWQNRERERMNERAGKGVKGWGRGMKGWVVEKEGAPALKWHRSEGKLQPGCLSSQASSSTGHVHIKGCFTATAGRISPSHTSVCLCVHANYKPLYLLYEHHAMSGNDIRELLKKLAGVRRNDVTFSLRVLRLR